MHLVPSEIPPTVIAAADPAGIPADPMLHHSEGPTRPPGQPPGRIADKRRPRPGRFGTPGAPPRLASRPGARGAAMRPSRMAAA